MTPKNHDLKGDFREVKMSYNGKLRNVLLTPLKAKAASFI